MPQEQTLGQALEYSQVTEDRGGGASEEWIKGSGETEKSLWTFFFTILLFLFTISLLFSLLFSLWITKCFT